MLRNCSSCAHTIGLSKPSPSYRLESIQTVLFRSVSRSNAVLTICNLIPSSSERFHFTVTNTKRHITLRDIYSPKLTHIFRAPQPTFAVNANQWWHFHVRRYDDVVLPSIPYIIPQIGNEWVYLHSKVVSCWFYIYGFIWMCGAWCRVLRWRIARACDQDILLILYNQIYNCTRSMRSIIKMKCNSCWSKKWQYFFVYHCTIW